MLRVLVAWCRRRRVEDRAGEVRRERWWREGGAEIVLFPEDWSRRSAEESVHRRYVERRLQRSGGRAWWCRWGSLKAMGVHCDGLSTASSTVAAEAVAAEAAVATRSSAVAEATAVAVAAETGRGAVATDAGPGAMATGTIPAAKTTGDIAEATTAMGEERAAILASKKASKRGSQGVQVHACHLTFPCSFLPLVR